MRKPVYEVSIQVPTINNYLTAIRVLTTEDPNVVYGDWSETYKPIGYIEIEEN